MIETVPCIVVGAGAVGLAVTRALAARNCMTFCLDRHPHVGAENSSRNSEVLHAGIYYPANSLKAKFCVEGKRRLESYINERRIPHNRLGKLIIAPSSKETPALRALFKRGLDNGAEDLSLIDEGTANAMEPNIICSEAIWSKNTGIFDSHAYLSNLEADVAESSSSSMVLLNCTVLSIEVLHTHVSASFADFGPRYKILTSLGTIGCNILVNCAGIEAISIANKISTKPWKFTSVYGKHFSAFPKAVFAKGNYYKLINDHVSPASCSPGPVVSLSQASSSSSRRPPFSRLIYPMPVDGGLGIHATLDLSGDVRFGPDVEWMQTLGVEPAANAAGIDWSIDDTKEKRSEFCDAIRRYWPAVRPEALAPDYAGIRAKVALQSQVRDEEEDEGARNDSAATNAHKTRGILSPEVDFVIAEPKNHGLPGVVHLLGIESPGLTSSLAIAEYVADIICDNNN